MVVVRNTLAVAPSTMMAVPKATMPVEAEFAVAVADVAFAGSCADCVPAKARP